MVKLSGILEYSMGGFLCLRGFASYKMLSGISQPNPAVQRDLIEAHKGEMATFLNQGEYRFFPEVILSLNLTDGKSGYDLLEDLHGELHKGNTWNKQINGFQFSVSQNQTKNILGPYSPLPAIERINIAHVKFDENEHALTRIDGNHRLSAAEETFLAAFAAYPGYDPARSSLATWLTRIAHNKAVNLVRSAPYRRETALLENDPDHDNTAQDETRYTVLWLYAQLTREEREFLDLRYVMGLTDKEVGALYGLESKAVNKRYQRLLKRCRAILDGGGKKLKKV